MADDDIRWLSVAEVADHLGVKPDTVYKWVTRKHIPSHKVGRLRRFNLHEIDAWIRSGQASNHGHSDRK